MKGRDTRGEGGGGREGVGYSRGREGWRGE